MSIVVRYQPKSLTAEKYDATTAQLEAAEPGMAARGDGPPHLLRDRRRPDGQ